MKHVNSGISVCRHCQHYLLEGRRGGQCQQLGTYVLGCWKACPLAIPPFAPSWEAPIAIADAVETLWSAEDAAVAPGIASNQAIEALEACIQVDMERSEPEMIKKTTRL